MSRLVRPAPRKVQETASEAIADSNSCELCGAVIGPEPAVTIATGGQAHVRCADREAMQMWRRRQALALGHAVALLVMIGAMLWQRLPPLAIVVLAVAAATLHARLHRRYWHIVTRDLRRRRR